MKFVPKSEKEIIEDGLWPDGTYDAVVFDATDKISKAGNEMIELALEIYDNEGRKRQVRDYLMEAVIYKVRQAADAMGLIDRYDAGDLGADDFMGKSCQVKIGRSRDKNGVYPDQNIVKSYVIAVQPERSEPARKQKQPVAADIDDEIPF